MSNRKELTQRINSFNSLLEKMKINPETISIKFIKDDFEDIKKLNVKLNGIYDELTLCYEKEVDEIRCGKIEKEYTQSQFVR